MNWLEIDWKNDDETTYGLFEFGNVLGVRRRYDLELAARAAYESADYKVVQSHGNIEIREYPSLVLAATTTQIDRQGRDGSFMRLFRYISGANETNEKIEMTTPVFMERASDGPQVQMGFVMPKNVAANGAPDPTGDGVKISQRKGGRFVVIRFAGQLTSKLAKTQEQKLRAWMKSRGLEGEAKSESAGYDPPFTPSALRRNEVLIRIKTDK